MEARPPERHRPQQHSRLATASTLRVLQVRSSPMRPPPGLSLPDSAGLGSDSRNQSEFFGASRWPSALCVGPRADHADRGPDAGPKWLREEVGWFGLLPFAFFLSFFLSLSLSPSLFGSFSVSVSLSGFLSFIQKRKKPRAAVSLRCWTCLTESSGLDSQSYGLLLHGISGLN